MAGGQQVGVVGAELRRRGDDGQLPYAGHLGGHGRHQHGRRIGGGPARHANPHPVQRPITLRPDTRPAAPAARRGAESPPETRGCSAATRRTAASNCRSAAAWAGPTRPPARGACRPSAAPCRSGRNSPARPPGPVRRTSRQIRSTTCCGRKRLAEDLDRPPPAGLADHVSLRTESRRSSAIAARISSCRLSMRRIFRSLAVIGCIFRDRRTSIVFTWGVESKCPKCRRADFREAGGLPFSYRRQRRKTRPPENAG